MICAVDASVVLPLDAKHEPLNPNGGGSLISGRPLTRCGGLLVGITVVTGKNRVYEYGVLWI